MANGNITDGVILCNLSKWYGNPICSNRQVALDGLAIEEVGGECLGLLGVNGAGKSTVFEVLMGKKLVTSGTAVIDGNKVTSDIRQAYTKAGYYSSSDLVMGYLTSREMLWMIGRLNCFEPNYIASEVERLARFLAMRPMLDKKLAHVSEGARQKLLLAVALIGHQSVILLDGATTSMESLAKRRVWLLMSNYRNHRYTIMLSTNCMAEAEMMCTRLGIMQQGRLIQLGNIEHLRDNLHRPYTLKLMVRDADQSAALLNVIQSKFESSVFNDRIGAMLVFSIPHRNIHLKDIFDSLGTLRKDYSLEEFSIGPTALTELFKECVDRGANQHDSTSTYSSFSFETGIL